MTAKHKFIRVEFNSTRAQAVARLATHYLPLFEMLPWSENFPEVKAFLIACRDQPQVTQNVVIIVSDPKCQKTVFIDRLSDFWEAAFDPDWGIYDHPTAITGAISIFDEYWNGYVLRQGGFHNQTQATPITNTPE